MKKPAVSEEMAIDELSVFLKKYKKREFRKGQMTNDRILDEYPNIIDAIMDGFLVFEDAGPKLTLREPIETETKDKELGVYNVAFRTRVKPSDQARIMDGINIQTQQAKYVLKFLSYVTGLSSGEIDKLGKEDYDTINQLCSVF
ncbi:hypothetical protein [Ulvibacterium sp.]|uniref:hypothetical protein n=1 Tax=Ulvibacterium sp. TaxID=2665914 RepID=UPI00262B15DA|nr:hypothetical protein [Ulvibacterium sp.]